MCTPYHLLMAQTTFVVNRPGWEKCFHSLTGTLGGYVRQKTNEVERAIQVEVPRPGGIPHNMTGIQYATGEMASTIKSRVTMSDRTPEGRVMVGTKHAKFVIHGTRPHIIVPKTPGGRLKFFWVRKGVTVITKKVNHPGTAANDFMWRGMKRGMRSIG